MKWEKPTSLFNLCLAVLGGTVFIFFTTGQAVSTGQCVGTGVTPSRGVTLARLPVIFLTMTVVVARFALLMGIRSGNGSPPTRLTRYGTPERINRELRELRALRGSCFPLHP
jgi:hypothetical protein